MAAKTILTQVLLLFIWFTWHPALAAAQFPNISLALHASGFTSPVHITHAGDGSGRLFVVEQTGRVRIIKNQLVVSTPFLDISDRVSCCGERGLLSLAFPPGFGPGTHFYVFYTDLSGRLQISRFFVTCGNPDEADPFSEEKILSIEHPTYANHNGGQLAFGFDGYLYIGTGDGGGGGDPNGNAQNPGVLLGKMLRIDVESGVIPYAVPPSNPFVGSPLFHPEIWALGLRNPWRFSFDRLTGDLYIGDVGQSALEEVDFASVSSPGGENYGWNIMEGTRCFINSQCDPTGLVLPVAEYDHSLGCSITGGTLYRGAAYPSLQGIYLYGDYCSGRIWGLSRDSGAWHSSPILDTGRRISTFGEDEAGEVYLADLATGAIFQVTVEIPFVLGDIAPHGSPDGFVNIADALLALRIASGLIVPTQADLDRGNVAPLGNPDQEINIMDVLLILQKATGLTSF